MSHRPVAALVRYSLALAALLALGAFAQSAAPAAQPEVKRPARMEAATSNGARAPDAADAMATSKHARLPGLQPDGLITLHDQWSLSPAGRHVTVGDFPVNIAVRPDGKTAAVLHSGNGTHEVIIVDLASRDMVARVTVPESFYGLSYAKDGRTLYASGGEYDLIHVWKVDADGLLSDHAEITVCPREQSFVVAGLSMSPDGKTLYACGPWGHRVAEIGLDGEGTGGTPVPQGGEGKASKFIDLPADSFPYAVLPTPDGKRLYVSLWGGSAIAVLDAASHALLGTWPTPSHPTEMALSPDGETLYVACSNSNSVAALDTQSGKPRELINTALYPNAPSGSTPSSLALSADGHTLLIANSQNNNLAVIDVSSPGNARPQGFIPVGWYPTSVRFDPKGDILVADGKGLTPRTNRHGPMPGLAAKNLREYIGSLHQGAVSFIKMPNESTLKQLTGTAYKCAPLVENAAVVAQPFDTDNPIPVKVGGPSPIKHCIYIIKENRTYDQVFGDMKEGNGDASICLFPEAVTPNQHALAREFVLLDNFYVNSEVSADGHEWTMAAYATDFVEKTWPINYRRQPKNAEIRYPSEGSYDIAVPAGGYIWDRCAEAGVSYMSMGEWVENGKTPDDPCTAKVKALEGHIDPKFRSFDTGYSDVKRAERFIENLAGWEKAGEMPQFMIVRLPNDHTAGTGRGSLTPTAMVAENDLAVGMVIEALGKSQFWKDSAVFIVEDDAQNGSDHIDAHRSNALVISPYTKRHVVDSSLYSTSSFLRTMELILGLQPMSQFDAAALPLYASFTATPDLTPYKVIEPQVDIHARNAMGAWGQDESEEMDFSQEDRADDIALNDIIWHSVRGEDSEMPAPVRAAFVFTHPVSDDDDD
ncbi:MAG: beta-propeller fold lactonase family protein [Phycisphaerales bacterium]|jgi:DNA-binding beta-propeller fold protein YncE